MNKKWFKAVVKMNMKMMKEFIELVDENNRLKEEIKRMKNKDKQP